MRQRQKALGKQTEALCQGERLLARQRYQFGQGWPQTSMVEAAYADFETILGRRCAFRIDMYLVLGIVYRLRRWRFTAYCITRKIIHPPRTKFQS